MTKYAHCMVDLETQDTRATSAIASIGACKFDRNGIFDTYYRVVDTNSCVELGLTRGQQTLSWWADQSLEARKIFDPKTEKLALKEALAEFSAWLNDGHDYYLWGYGAEFDNAILGYAYDLTGLKKPWKYSNSRCLRTVMNGAKISQKDRQGTYHNALDDAVTQAEYMVWNDLIPEEPSTGFKFSVSGIWLKIKSIFK